MKKLTASEARIISDSKNIRKIDITEDQVWELIKNYCENGHFNVLIEGNIGQETMHKLKANGYNVESDEFPTKCNPYAIQFYISWQA